MSKRWWRIWALVEAGSEAEALAVLRREGIISRNHVLYADGRVILEKITETESPWKPAHTAPKDGRPFIAFDEKIKHAETARWSGQEGKFVNYVGNQEVPFTRWMDQPS
ncbi:MAG: hypothetical protein WA728_32150 [Xanthobacteraceae bacterium]